MWLKHASQRVDNSSCYVVPISMVSLNCDMSILHVVFATIGHTPADANGPYTSVPMGQSAPAKPQDILLLSELIPIPVDHIGPGKPLGHHATADDRAVVLTTAAHTHQDV
jgi:hypothetical protein